MHLVAGGTKFRNLRRILMKGLQKHIPVGLGIELDGKVREAAAAGSGWKRCGQGRIFNHKVPLPHRVFHMNDRVAGHAAQTDLALRRVLDLANRMILHLCWKRPAHGRGSRRTRSKA